LIAAQDSRLRERRSTADRTQLQACAHHSKWDQPHALRPACNTLRRNLAENPTGSSCRNTIRCPAQLLPQLGSMIRHGTRSSHALQSRAHPRARRSGSSTAEWLPRDRSEQVVADASARPKSTPIGWIINQPGEKTRTSLRADTHDRKHCHPVIALPNAIVHIDITPVSIA